ncbi:hypothetical protein FH972_023801 [Carpinus fangiana]|uniref:Major facilitator superfamily (MFS) profile domain-containing protein n=1 Tax=Carpinus fangiana TaxID=176857 RepID=A0A5N6KWH2_9ROSI|nr:hypothetical protein FH972_023801 [Carpinus fangiana]
MDEPELLTPSRVTRVFKEIGLHSLYHSPADTKLLCFQRFVRLLAYGGATLILVPYLKLLGINETKIGLFMTLTLVGDILISFFLTMFADRLGRRAVVAVGALLMSGSGIAFALSGNYVVLLLAAIFGVISPSGNEIGPFRAIEESALAQLSSSEVRSDIFAWYSLTSSAGAAVGTIVFGWVVQTLQARGWTTLASYRVVFFAYAATGIFKLALVCLLSKKVEPEKKPPPPHPEEEPLLRNEVAATPEVKKSLFLPHISKETTRLTIQLCLAFALDSFASGLASMSWVMYYFYTKFNLKEGQLGTIFSIGWVISTFSVLVASSIAKRIGNVKVSRRLRLRVVLD